MRRFIILASAITVLFTAMPASAQFVVEHLGYEIVGEFALPTGLTGSIGDIMFSADGLTAYFLDRTEEETSSVYSMTVIRDGDNVVGFNSVMPEFTEPWMDTGLEFAPGSTTLFFRGYDPVEAGIGQRQFGGGTEYKVINNYTGDYGGLAFFPSMYSNSGNLVSSSYDDGTIFLHTVTDDGDGTYTVADGSLYADFSALALTEGIGDIEFFTSGPLAETLLIAFHGHTDEAVSFIDLDSATGFPIGGTTQTPIPFLSGTDEVWGLGIDPITTNIWVTFYEPTTGPHLIEIAGPLFADGFESGDMMQW